MLSSEKLSKVADGLRNIELKLKNIEYKYDKKGYSDHSILCQGEILKINGVENGNLFFSSGIGRKLDLSHFPTSFTKCDEIEISLFESTEFIEKNYVIYDPRFEVNVDLPIGVIATINEKINENYAKEQFLPSMTINFVKPIFEAYKTGYSTISKDDKILIYLGEQYEDDDSQYGCSGEVKININLSVKGPYSIKNESIFSFRC